MSLLNTFIQAQRMNPYPLYTMMRKVKPVVQIPKYKIWVAFRYDDVRKVLSDYANFSSDFQRGMRQHPEFEQNDSPLGASLIASDPPLHTKLRNLVSRAFTTRAIANLEPRIEQLTHQMLDRVCDSGSIDLIQDLAYPLPVIVIAEMLGIPPEDRAKFKLWSDEIVASSDRVLTARDSEKGSNRTPEMQEMAAYFHDIIQQRRRDPQDDLISGLVNAELDGESLSEHELLSFASLLLVAGNETTTNLIGNAILTFLDHPEALAQVRSDLTLLPGAIEEVLRFRSPVQAMFRVVAQEVELGGRLLQPDQWVIAAIGAANRDERKFKNAGSFDITRTPNPHIAFGFGIHHCLGAPLARLEARTALRIILERLHNMKRADNRKLEPAAGFIINGVRSLPLTFTPASRILSK